MVSPILKLLGLYIYAVSDLGEFQDAKDGMRTCKFADEDSPGLHHILTSLICTVGCVLV